MWCGHEMQRRIAYSKLIYTYTVRGYWPARFKLAMFIQPSKAGEWVFWSRGQHTINSSWSLEPSYPIRTCKGILVGQYHLRPGVLCEGG